MKKQILTLIIGILIGAIITTGVFLILKGNSSNESTGRMNMDGNQNFMDMDSEERGNGKFNQDNMNIDENETSSTSEANV